MKTGNLISRPRLTCALALTAAALALPGRAQTSQPASTDETVTLNQFEVKSSVDNSYTVDSATAGLKSRQELVDIATPIQVMPRSVIDDLGFDWLTTDYARFVSSGLNSYGANNIVYLRGQKQSWMFKDGIQYFPSVDDDFGVETVEVVKGINASLFGSLPAVSGMVLLTSKEPLPIQQDSIKAMADANGGVQRVEIDSTGPLGEKLFGAKVTYRVLAMAQHGDMKQIYNDDRLLYSPSFQLDWGKTILRVRYEYSDITNFGLYTDNFLDENNNVSTIGGLGETYKAPWSRSRFKKSEFEVNLTSLFTPDFQGKLQIAYYQELRTDHDNRAYLVAAPGLTALNGNVIIPVNSSSTLASTLLQLAQTQYTLAINDDYVANFNVLGSGQQINFGIDANYLYNSQALVQPYLGSISVINPVLPADPGPAALPGSADTIAITNVGNVYAQDQARFFSDKLTLTAGGNWGYNQTTSHKAVAAPAYAEAKGHALTYKLAALYKLTPELSLYTSRATAFVPQSPGIADQNGNPLPAITSIDEEAGIKTAALFNGLISGSAGFYRSSTFNQSVVVNAGTAGGYYQSSGRTDTRGLEFDLTLKPFAGAEIIGTLFHGNGVWSSASAAYINRSYKETGSVLAKYTFGSGGLKGLAVGGTMFRQGQIYILPMPSYPAWTIYGMFATYSFKHIQLGLNLDNVGNELYDAGGNNRYQVAIGIPRTLKGSVKYRF